MRASSAAVFAVPASPARSTLHGTNGLLKDGAQIVTDRDIIRSMARSAGRPFLDVEAGEPATRGRKSTRLPPSDSERDRITMHWVRRQWKSTTLSATQALAPKTVYMVLLELDIAGRLYRHPAGLFRLI